MINTLANAARRFRRAAGKHGIRWTIERSIAMWRGKVAVHGPLGAVRQLLPTQPDIMWSPALTDEKGVVPAVRTTNEKDFAFEIPFVQAISHSVPRVAVIAQIFYVEYAEEMLRYFRNITVPADLYIATDTEEKRDALRLVFESFAGGSVEIRVTPNRGRDIGPKLVAFRDVYTRYEHFLQVHTKRSPHGGDALSSWRGYLLEHLVGSREIVDANLALLTTDNIGIVFPQHMAEVRGVLNWGYDFRLAKDLLARAGIQLSKNQLLEFPSGSMFWARSDALRRLLALNLSFDDFDEEQGQVDGTLAHAIERSYLLFCEAAGYAWAKVSRRDLYPFQGTLQAVRTREDIRTGMRLVYRSVLPEVQTTYSPFERALPVVKRIAITPSQVSRGRLNLLIPTVNPFQVFGGVATALSIFSTLGQRLGDTFDARIIVTDASLDEEALQAYRDYAIHGARTAFDHEPRIVLDVADRKGTLPLRRGDVFIASAWWNAKHAAECRRLQRSYFGFAMPFVYLIQDFEPYFSAWSSQWAAAESTYHETEETIAIINSNELYRYMARRYTFPTTYVLPYRPNAVIQGALQPVEKERIILIYGRPSVARNCFEVILDGLLRWQATNPQEAANWQIVSLGEAFPPEFAYPLQNFSVRGKVSLQEYSALLSRASIGISLMISPHPSYPPLEMAMAGLLTITNRFEEKDLSVYSDAIINPRGHCCPNRAGGDRRVAAPSRRASPAGVERTAGRRHAGGLRRRGRRNPRGLLQGSTELRRDESHGSVGQRGRRAVKHTFGPLTKVVSSRNSTMSVIPKWRNAA